MRSIAQRLVWPLPISLATTFGISVDFFSSPYLDVSVRAVPLIELCIHSMIHGLDPVWVSPFGNLRIDAYLPLPVAYRSLSRPSSAPSAKAFPLRSFSLNLFALHAQEASDKKHVTRTGDYLVLPSGSCFPTA